MNENETLTYEDIKRDWFLVTKCNMDSKDLDLLESNFQTVNRANLYKSGFERLKKNWMLITGSISFKDFKKLKRDYMSLNWTKISLYDLEQLRKNWMLFAGHFEPDDIETLKRDYLVLNWTMMTSIDYKRFKTNWSLLTKRLGMDNQENIIKSWVLYQIPYEKYSKMSEKEKVQFIKFHLDRGADVNAQSRAGYSLLQIVTSDKLMMIASLVDLLLRYGADYTVRTPDEMTPLDTVRINYYKNHQEIVTLLQAAEESAKHIPCNSRTIFNNDTQNKDHFASDLNRPGISGSSQMIGDNSSRQSSKDEIQKQWVQTYESPYLIRVAELFKNAVITDIDYLLQSVINHMFITKMPKLCLKLNHYVDRYDNIINTHRVYSKMCSKLFNIFDSEFEQEINITFPDTARLCEDAELVVSIEIHPEVEWVALKLYAVPSDLEYFIVCAAGSRIRFKISRDHRNHFSLCSQNLICPYEDYLGAYQQRFL